MTEPTMDDIRSRLAAHQPRRLAPEGMRLAAVLVPLFVKDGQWWVLLTKRTQTVEHHKGEISFPGGHRDPEDLDFETTARRETREEIGVAENAINVLGRLDDILTITGFRIRPFVGVIPYPLTTTASPHEIAEIITLPIAGFLEPGRCSIKSFTRAGQSYPVYFFNVGGHTVWGATAKILKGFIELVFTARYD
jgi:8-oxo-dGTP pyrophosphatase MutT (NUDIX family)